MKKGQVFILVSILLCSSLILAACSPSGGPTSGKSGGETPTAAAQSNASAAYPAQSGAPTQPVAYPATSAAPQSAPTTPPEGYPAQTGETPAATLSVTVVKADGTSTALAGKDLYALTQTPITVGQSDQTGYKLSDVLAAAGVTSFQQVVVTGTSGSTTLTQSQVTPEVILSTVDPNSLQLASPSFTAEQSVKGVNKIEVK